MLGQTRGGRIAAQIRRPLRALLLGLEAGTIPDDAVDAAVWTVAVIPGGLAGVLVYAVTNNSTITWTVGIAVGIGYVLWVACSVYTEPEK